MAAGCPPLLGKAVWRLGGGARGMVGQPGGGSATCLANPLLTLFSQLMLVMGVAGDSPAPLAGGWLLKLGAGPSTSCLGFLNSIFARLFALLRCIIFPGLREGTLASNGQAAFIRLASWGPLYWGCCVTGRYSCSI